ncbi:hypothetical protein KSB_01960 [Ktedonobacter robiniae]|uniref:Uncharacterized protein n=1 Tax=Ktedonobacter robiniae TaxID=2778365 RepID=A0ABQ3UG82_9CHLR|nr:hypothetical protein KSB_01960 [Ktedonobacter robiniae]
MREETVQKGQWIGLVAGTFFALTGTRKSKKSLSVPLLIYKRRVYDSPSGADWPLERRSIPTICADSPRFNLKSLQIRIIYW